VGAIGTGIDKLKLIEQLPWAKKKAARGRPPPACHRANRPFFQDT
jgi:hypothetical protein